MGTTYCTAFRNIFPALAEKNHLALIPFLLQNVGGIPRLNQSDGIHPNAAGHRLVADNVWHILKPLL
jgi:acyl-CoA thioesterase-1